jgi:hypothetical protein
MIGVIFDRPTAVSVDVSSSRDIGAISEGVFPSLRLPCDTPGTGITDKQVRMATETNPYAKVIAQAWSDEDFKQRLKDDPHAALAEHGIDAPPDTRITVVENTADAIHLVLPAAPDGEISEEELANVSGGTCMMSGVPCDCGV